MLQEKEHTKYHGDLGGRGKRSHLAVGVKTSFSKASAVEMDLKSKARISTGARDKIERKISHTEKRRWANTGKVRGILDLHTYMQHNWNGLHLDWRRYLEACI